MDDLLALDITDDVGSELTPRQERILKAFQKSKESYANEIVFTPPGWYDADGDPLERLSENKDTDTFLITLRRLEFSIQRLYLQKEYEKCLERVLGFLDLLSSESFPPEGKGDAREREMLDIAMRCTIKSGNVVQAGLLADRSRPKWRSLAGIAATAGEAYIVAQRPRDAITAILLALHLRGVSYPHLKLLARAFSLRETQLLAAGVTPLKKTDAGTDFNSDSDSTTPSELEAVQALYRICREGTERVARTYAYPLFHPGPAETGESREPPPPRDITITSSMVEQWGTACGLTNDDLAYLVELCTFEAAETDGAAGDEGGKSVRLL
ncbi:hypothetical protein BOTBODRAFT_44403 [Botryobasidium botryosum FD-172 SS1]|uniref:Uncharacterized protein n=1 Tax=Botryobasidium botryosum (strain FD-172 SS1) TaxID=930990 RepID=A0A067MSU0_BOTB1|nr:hypothetical protein BOTBODRAFT_44403 [Botryobasidium botryosum FD-172 SS1]